MDEDTHTILEAAQYKQTGRCRKLVVTGCLSQRYSEELLAELRDQVDAPPVIVLTATKTVNSAVEAMKQGAADYVTKVMERMGMS